MKQIKFFIIAAGLLGLLASCDKTDLTPATGSTQVQFVETLDTLDIIGEYFDIPLRQVTKSQTATKVEVEIVSVSGTYVGGAEFNNVPDSTVILTSSTVYVGPWTDEPDADSVTSFEIRLPEYRVIQELTIEFSISGDHVAEPSTATYVFESVAQYNMEGTFYFSGDPNQSMQITADPSDPTVYYISIMGEKTDEFKATRSINTLTAPAGQSYTDASGRVWQLFSFTYNEEEQQNYLKEGVVFEFRSDDEIYVPEGFFAGFLDGDSYAGKINAESGSSGRRI
ncbi:MAG TPA: hypothetical protein IAC04_01465 [Candidatus Coprenecus stercoravium]|uniref:Uncharacterized protein n=1 Tax=Candidatus Coprenecus stercoravium TaxID=2840735 RepID=A0A9D2K879_9BACT|nr:hypothetical protein [Candidatus Coprenecus stercoravium]